MMRDNYGIIDRGRSIIGVSFFLGKDWMACVTGFIHLGQTIPDPLEEVDDQIEGQTN